MNNELTTQQMIEALSLSTNEIVAKKCNRILNGETTVEEEIKSCGRFMYQVFTGNYKNAFAQADAHNRVAFVNYQNKLDSPINSLDWFIEQTCGADSKVWAKEIATAKRMYEIEMAKERLKAYDKIFDTLNGKG